MRLGTACQRLPVQEFHQDGYEATLRLQEKGNKRRTIGLTSTRPRHQRIHRQGRAFLRSLFRPRLRPRSQPLAVRPLEPSAFYKLIRHYLKQLPGALKKEQLPDGSSVQRCIYTPHSLRATTATLLLDAGVDIIKVKDLLGRHHVTTTQIDDKRRRSTSESASHLLAI